MKQKFIKLFIYFGLVHLIFLMIHIIYDFNGMKILLIGKEALNDISFNDFHYRIADDQLKKDAEKDYLLHYKDPKYPKEICLINIADLPDSNFRESFIQLVNELQSFSPKAIGVDITFNKDLPKSKEIENLAKKYNNIIWARVNNNENLNFGDENMGSIDLIDETTTIRKYTSSQNSFAYKLAQRAYPNLKFKSFKDTAFFIHYNSIGNGMVRYDKVNDPKIELNYHYIPAEDLLKPSSDMNKMLSLDAELSNSVVIIGYLGTESRRNFDIEDKYCTPTDINNLVQREPLMYGSLIHANAFYNIVHEESRYSEWTGWPFILISNLLLLLFLWFLIFFHFPKIVNITVVTLLTLPALYLTVKLMEYGIYISVGATILHVIVIEEVVEVIDPFIITRVRSLKDYLKETHEICNCYFRFFIYRLI